MAVTLVIKITCEDESDLDWIRNKVMNSVDDVISQQVEEERLDGEVHTDWEIEND